MSSATLFLSLTAVGLLADSAADQNNEKKTPSKNCMRRRDNKIVG